MVNTKSEKDLVPLKELADLLQDILENPDSYDVVNFEAEKGTARTQIAEEADHAMQRIGISVTYLDNNA